MTQQKTATLVRDNLESARGHAAVYKVDPPIDVAAADVIVQPGGPYPESVDYVIVSSIAGFTDPLEQIVAAMLGFQSGPQTVIFLASDASGEYESAFASFEQALDVEDHAAALTGEGYQILVPAEL